MLEKEAIKMYTILIIALTKALLLLARATLVWLLWSSTIPQFTDALPAEPSWGSCVLLTWMVGLLFTQTQESNDV